MNPNAIDLSLIPAPAIVKVLSYEAILAAMIDDLTARHPEFSALLESDPAFKILEVVAYRELGLRQRVNDAAKAVMLSYAVGSDLDNLAALFNLTRHVIDPGNPSATPPVEPILESDPAFRKRANLAMEGLTTAGSVGSYISHALNAHAHVKDASAVSPTPGDVVVTILSHDGVPTDEVIAVVADAVSAKDVRPLTDRVKVVKAALVTYTVNATLSIAEGVSQNVVLSAARTQLEAYVAEQTKLGASVPVSGIYAALHQQAGIRRVQLKSPTADITTTLAQAPQCTAIKLEVTNV